MDLSNANLRPTYLKRSKRGVGEFIVNSAKNQKC
ncbi:hypothetical protein Gotri_027369 [Gossypium trilobum]|uniref:Uncharacterized protein n=1 Tax=Gossypium trilobum TaxID=34281 RepID=A0A7J9FID0_9ROSI|nr:hypothetical protein [Gossypium trilobum]